MCHCSPALLYVSQIPDFDPTLVAPAEKEICRTTVPTNHVDVAVMRLLNACDILSPFTPHVPHAHALICRARCKDGRLARAPLDILNTRSMRGKRRFLRSEARGRACRQV